MGLNNPSNEKGYTDLPASLGRKYITASSSYTSDTLSAYEICVVGTASADSFILTLPPEELAAGKIYSFRITIANSKTFKLYLDVGTELLEISSTAHKVYFCDGYGWVSID